MSNTTCRCDFCVILGKHSAIALFLSTPIFILLHTCNSNQKYVFVSLGHLQLLALYIIYLQLYGEGSLVRRFTSLIVTENSRVPVQLVSSDHQTNDTSRYSDSDHVRLGLGFQSRCQFEWIEAAC